MRRLLLSIIVTCVLLSACSNTDDIDQQVEITCEEIRTLVDLDFMYTNYTHYDSDLISFDQDEYITRDNNLYFKITDTHLDTWAEWEELCESIYSSKLLQVRLKETENTVINVDGYAYVRPGSQGRPISSDYECRIIEQSDGRAVAEAIYTSIHEEDFGDEIIYTYELTYTPSGWRITSVG